MAMKRVRIEFYLEPSDPEHSTGMTTEHFEQVQEAVVGWLGGDDIEIEVIEEEERDEPIRQRKPGRKG